MSGEPAGPVDVLYVDSDPADAIMVQESFALADNNVRLHIARDGRQALRFVRGLGEFRGAPRPRLILLELNPDDVPGLDVLAELKGDSDLMTIPVVILSSAQDPASIHGSYELHANAYIVKPADFDGLAGVIRQLSASFIRQIQPPPGTASR
jgi:DNA-binding response OmpR family regulator